MEKKMRRQDKLMPYDECVEVLETAEYGMLATVSTDDTPYITPINFIYTNGAIYFHCAKEGHKIENIKHNKNVCFNVVDSVELMPEKFSTKFRSAMVFGTIEIVEDIDEKRKSICAIAEKFSPDYHDEGLKYIDSAFDNIYMLKVNIDRITGKAAK
ncbi:MAG: pyridoxamine 5'-phosphate oxidase family protein [Anaerovoracaceae bacterium]